MRAVLLALFTVSTLAVLGCSRAEPQASEPAGSMEAPPPGAPAKGGGRSGPVGSTNAAGIKQLDQKKFGDGVTSMTTTPLPDLAKDPAQFTNKTVRTEGVVSAVCQSMGCWMQIADASGTAHIKMAGHKFFVPKESSGHRALVQGKVMQASAGACGADGCGNQEVTQVEIEATGVEFID
jgi:hypothetical protein